MNKSFYPRLALENCIKNGKFYFPYLLTVICTAAAFYICVTLSTSPWVSESELLRYSYLSMFMTIGVFILGFFIVVFLLYTNSFLMKRRVRELGLYHVLGMGKRHIALVLSYESLYTWITGVGGGILLGMLLQRLVTMLAQKLMRVDIVLHFAIVPEAMLTTGAFFGGCLLLTLLVNLRRVRLQNPVELLRGGQVGERQPRTRWLIALLGVLTLGGGYYLAVVIKNPIDALANYFVAVALVILGTYCLFSAVSILVLKLMRYDRRFYYKTGNFIGVSGMLHRMNRNAVGLANICILSTMVMVMVSSTLSLFVGTEDALQSRYPAQINVRIRYPISGGFDEKTAAARLTAAVEEQGAAVTDTQAYTVSGMEMYKDGDGFVYADEDLSGMNSFADVPYTVIFMTAQGYNDRTGESLSLQKGELSSTMHFPSGAVSFSFPQDGGERRLEYKTAGALKSDFYLPDYGVMALKTVYFILPDMDALREITELKSRMGGTDNLAWYFGIDTNAAEDEQQRIGNLISVPEVSGMDDRETVGYWELFRTECRGGLNTEEFYSLNGGFFFLGIFLGFIFIVAMALIMYYRQISEGYEDRERFQIMQQVGLTRREIKKSINAQVLIVFFAPLIVAGVHVAFDYNLVRMLLTLFSVYNGTLTAWCSLITFGAFALIYAVMYLTTARTYYNIVSE